MAYTFCVEQLEKTLGQRKIIKGISLSMQSGRVYGIIGPNSAGKTTLTKLLSGSLIPDSGEIMLDGIKLTGMDARLFIRQGIIAVYNDRVAFGSMRVKDFLLLSQATAKRVVSIAQSRKTLKKAKELFSQYQLTVDFSRSMQSYPLGMQKLIELFMSMLSNPKVLILDELDPWFEGKTKELFFQIIEDLCKKNCIVLIISHELPTIRRACQVISLVKEGMIVGTETAELMTAQKMIDDFFSAEKQGALRHQQRCGEEVLRVEHLSGVGIEDISFSIKEGEVVGLSGNRAAARTSLAKTLMGEEKYKGDIFFRGKKIKVDNPEVAVNNGIAYVTSNILTEALFPGLSILQNMLPRFMQHQGSKKQQSEIVQHYLELLNIKESQPDLEIDSLSTGSQKKIVIARWLLSKSDVFIFERLSQNLDSIAIMDIFSIVLELQRMGKAVILISDHTRELLALSNCIHVFHSKRIAKTLQGKAINKEELLFYLTGN